MCDRAAVRYRKVKVNRPVIVALFVLVYLASLMLLGVLGFPEF